MMETIIVPEAMMEPVFVPEATAVAESIITETVPLPRTMFVSVTSIEPAPVTAPCSAQIAARRCTAPCQLPASCCNSSGAASCELPPCRGCRQPPH